MSVRDRCVLAGALLSRRRVPLKSRQARMRRLSCISLLPPGGTKVLSTLLGKVRRHANAKGLRVEPTCLARGPLAWKSTHSQIHPKLLKSQSLLLSKNACGRSQERRVLKPVGNVFSTRVLWFRGKTARLHCVDFHGSSVADVHHFR